MTMTVLCFCVHDLTHLGCAFPVKELAMLDYLETELTYPEFQLLLPIPRVL